VLLLLLLLLLEPVAGVLVLVLIANSSLGSRPFFLSPLLQTNMPTTAAAAEPPLLQPLLRPLLRPLLQPLLRPLLRPLLLALLVAQAARRMRELACRTVSRQSVPDSIIRSR
jgi:hypothetical protein